jgi:hypothetical protein
LAYLGFGAWLRRDHAKGAGKVPQIACQQKKREKSTGRGMDPEISTASTVRFA